MELLYLYIPESAGYILKDQQINFSARHKFNFDKETRILTYEENTKAVDGSFFTTENNKSSVVSSISAIVGDNGSGKTTIAEFINKIQWSSEEHILIWRSSNGEFKYTARIMDFDKKYSLPIFDQSDIKLNLMNAHNLGYTLIYSTNYYTPLHNIITINNTIDISTSQYLSEDKDKIENGTKTNLHPIAAHAMMEMVRHAELYHNLKSLSKKPDWELPTPKGVSIYVNNGDLEIFRDKHINSLSEIITSEIKKDFKDEDKLKKEVQRIIDEEIKSVSPKYSTDLENLLYKVTEPLPGKDMVDSLRINPETEYERFVISLFKSFLANYFRDTIEESYYWRKNYEKVVFYKIKNQEDTEIVNALKQLIDGEITIDSVVSFCNTASKINKKSFTKDQQSFLKDKFDYFIELIKLLRKENIQQDVYYIDFAKKDGLDHFENILDKYFSKNTITHFMSFRWKPIISAGELAQYNNYSRLHSVLKKGEVENDIVVFFDEIEITIHPRLQRRLVSNLIEFFNSFYKERRFKIHLIFASHSPILLSDIPKDHTIELKRNSTDAEVLPREIESFGANIHSLYEHHFRMEQEEGSLIGQFAFNKIKELVDKINNIKSDNLDKKQLAEIERELSVIGEPFMRHKIQELLEEKVPHINKVRYLQKRLKHLEEETERVKKELEGGNDA